MGASGDDRVPASGEAATTSSGWLSSDEAAPTSSGLESAEAAPTSSGVESPNEVATPWPFFAPSPAERMSAALDLADVGPGRRVCDLGCGDGRVLVAAASRGAEVVGVELDAALVVRARRALDAAGHTGEVRHGDLLVDPLPDADVYVTFLSAAVLQRLVARLEAETPPEGRSRLVSIVYRAAGLVPIRSAGGCHLHEVPGVPRPRRIGWNSAGLVVVSDRQHRLLTYALAGHPEGSVHLEVRGAAADQVVTMTGADSLAHRREIAVDFRWFPGTDPSPRFGAAHLEGVGPLRLLVMGAQPDGPRPGWWWVDQSEWDALADVADRHPGGFDPAVVIEAARADR